MHCKMLYKRHQNEQNAIADQYISKVHTLRNGILSNLVPCGEECRT